VKVRFIILDFCAARFYTHHWYYTYAYSSTLNSHNEYHEVWLPEYANDCIFDILRTQPKANLKIQKILKSPLFGPDNNKFFFRSEIKFLSFIIHSLPFKWWQHTMKKLWIRRLIKVPLLKLKEMNRDSLKDCTLIVPTLDILSLSLVEECFKRHINFKCVLLRVLSPTFRGVLSNGDEVERIASLSQKDLAIKIGFEVDSLMTRYQSVANEQKFLAPVPINDLCKRATHVPHAKSNGCPRLRVGVLGSAKLRKGLAYVSQIINEINGKYLNKFEFVIQEPAHVWDGYEEIKNIINETSAQTFFIDGALNWEELIYWIEQMDFILLPYLREEYAFSGSAMFYHAMDAMVPVICPDGLGFSSEVEKFGLGICFKSLDDLIIQLQGDRSEEYISNISNYNLYRKHSVALSLDLSDVNS